MGPTRGAVNVPDVILGCFLLFALPLGALLALKEQRPATEEAATPGKLPMSLEELDEARDEYARIYRENAKQLFLVRWRDPDLDPKWQAEEAAWARLALERAKKGLTDLLKVAKAASEYHEFQARQSDLEKLLRQIEDDLRMLPGSLPAPVPAAPPPPPGSPAPAPAPAPAAGG